MVGILRPLRAIELAQALGNEDSEIGRKVLEGVIFQHWHAVTTDVDGFESRASAEGASTNLLDGIRQGDALKPECAMERVLQLLHVIELLEVVEVYDGIGMEDSLHAFQSEILRGEEVPLVGE